MAEPDLREEAVAEMERRGMITRQEAARRVADIRGVPLATELEDVDAAFGFDDPMSMDSLAASFGMMLADDQDERARIITEQMPGVFEILEDAEGNLVARRGQEDFALNAPGISRGDFNTFFTRALATLPAGQARNAFARPILNLLARSAQIGGQSAAAEAALQGVEAALGGDFSGSEVALAGVTGAGAEGVIGTVSGLRRAARETQGAAAENIPQLGRTEEIVERTGVQFTRGQATLDPFLLEEQAFLGQMPEGARAATNFLKRQNEQVGQAVESFVQDFGNPRSVIVGPRKVRDAAQKAVELRRAIRAQNTNPLYERAWAEFDGTVNLSGLADHIDAQLLKYPKSHPAHKALTLFRKEAVGNADSLQRLQGVKEVVFAKKSTLKSKKAIREVTDAENLLRDAMEEASPVWKQANDTYRQQSTPVDSIMNSLTGRVSEIPDDRLRQVTRTIFEPTETSPAAVREARKAILAMDGGAEAWGDAVRLELERRLGSVRLSDGDFVENVPAQMRMALFGNKKAKDVLSAALTPEQREASKFLEDALRRAERGRTIGSQTGIRREISQRFDRGLVSAIRRLVREPITTLSGVGEDAARSARIRAVAELVFSEDWAGTANRIRRLAGDQEQRWFETLTQISNAMLQGARSQANDSERDETAGNPGESSGEQ